MLVFAASASEEEEAKCVGGEASVGLRVEAESCRTFFMEQEIE